MRILYVKSNCTTHLNHKDSNGQTGETGFKNFPTSLATQSTPTLLKTKISFKFH